MCHRFGNGAKNCKVRTIQLILTLFIIIRVKAETEIPKHKQNAVWRSQWGWGWELVFGSVTTAHVVVTLISRAACLGTGHVHCIIIFIKQPHRLQLYQCLHLNLNLEQGLGLGLGLRPAIGVILGFGCFGIRCCLTTRGYHNNENWLLLLLWLALIVLR